METIEEIKKQIVEVKKKITENKKLIKDQRTKFNLIKNSIKRGPRSLVKNSLFEPKQIDGIEIFNPDEDEFLEEEIHEEGESFEE